jgi:hypothetical protein
MGHNIIIVAVTMAATLLISCKSKEAVTKETTVTNKEQQTATKDSITHSSVIVKSDTTYSNEVTTIHKVVYDTSKKDCAGHYPILSVTDVNTTKNSGSRGKIEQTSNTTKVQISKQAKKQKTVDKKKDTQKVTSQVKEMNHLVKNIVLLILCVGVSIILIKNRKELFNIINKFILIFKE